MPTRQSHRGGGGGGFWGVASKRRPTFRDTDTNEVHSCDRFENPSGKRATCGDRQFSLGFTSLSVLNTFNRKCIVPTDSLGDRTARRHSHLYHRIRRPPPGDSQPFTLTAVVDPNTRSRKAQAGQQQRDTSRSTSCRDDLNVA